MIAIIAMWRIIDNNVKDEAVLVKLLKLSQGKTTYFFIKEKDK
jgi:hypothetical protein